MGGVYSVFGRGRRGKGCLVRAKLALIIIIMFKVCVGPESSVVCVCRETTGYGETY